MTKRRVIWLLCVVLTFIVFYFCIPTSVANLAPFVISLVGAVLLTAFGVQAIGDFRSWREFNNTPKHEQEWRHRTAPFLVLPGIAMLFVFVMHYSSNEKAELKEFGVRTTGIVIDGTALKSGRGGTYHVVVRFTTKEGKQMEVSESVGENEFNRVAKGQEIEMVYSQKDPGIIELFIDDVTRKAYDFEGAEKDIQVKDLFTFMNMENEKLGKTLNSMNYKWVYNPSDSTWHNDVRHLSVKAASKNTIVFSSFDMHEEGAPVNESSVFSKYTNQFKALQFSETKNDSIILYNKDNVSAEIKSILKNIGVGFQLGQEIKIEKKP